MKAIILAAGKSKRMNSSSSKLLFDLLGKPVILHVLDNVISAGINKIVMVLGAYKEQIEKIIKPYNLITVEQKEQKGTADAVMKTIELLDDEDVLILCGDTPLLSDSTLVSLINYYKATDSDMVILTSHLQNPGHYGRILRDIDGKIIKIVEYKDASETIKDIKEVNAGVYVLHSSSLKRVLQKIKPSHVTGEYYLTDLVWELYKEGGKIEGLCLKNYKEMLGINTREDLVEIGRILKERIIKKHLRNGVTIKDPLNTYIETNVKIGKDTVINPFTYLEGNTTIGKNCIVGPFAWLKDVNVQDNEKVRWQDLSD